MHKKLNAVMQMDPPGNRRRLGRNPTRAEQDSSPSPTDADSSNDAAPGGSNSAECRRSSRKKTIKFDVRDLLNKNRKNHKIQIEARIDSNAPKVGVGQISKAELDSKQKNFIEKSAIFRRYSISENKLPPRPPPPPGALMHTIQQCVGELEQLPLDGGELNLAAISPIARRLSRTQDILTATMMKPKQVSSLIVTKLESATTSKPATPPTRRRAGGVAKPSTSKEIQQKPRRGRKPKPKIFTESTTESSSNDSFDISTNQKLCAAKLISQPIATGIKACISPNNNSNTGIDLKENLDASAVTLPPPTVLSDCMRNSSDDSSSVATEEDMFIPGNLSCSDESSIGYPNNSSPGGTKSDEISLFGRSNSTETNSSDDSERRRRKVRISVKRVSLTPKDSSFDEKNETIDVISSSNDENSTSEEHVSDTIKTQLKGSRNESKECATPPFDLPEEDISNLTSVESSVIDISSCSGTPVKEVIEKSSKARRGRPRKQNEMTSKLTQEAPEANYKPVQKPVVPPQNIEVSLRNRSTSRKPAVNLPIDNVAATAVAPSSQIEEVASLIISENNVPCEDVPTSLQDSTLPAKSDEKEPEEKSKLSVRSLRSTQSVQGQLSPKSKKQKQSKHHQTEETTDNTSQKSPLEGSDESALAKDNLLEIESQELRALDDTEIHISKSPRDSYSPKTQKREKQSKQYKDSLAEDSKEKSETCMQQTRAGAVHPEKKVETHDSPLQLEEKATKTDENTKPSAEGESSKSEKESTDRSDTDSTNSDRRESLRTRSTVLPTKKEISKKVFKVNPDSSNVDSSSESSECHDKNSKGRKKISTNVDNYKSKDNKSNEETSSLCSESSSITSSTSASTSSSSTSTTSNSSSSSSSSSSTSSSSNSEARSTRSSRSTQKLHPAPSTTVKPIESQSTKKSDTENEEAINIIKTKSIEPESEYSKNSNKKLAQVANSNDTRYREIENLMEMRRTTRLERWSSDQERDTGSESSYGILNTSKTRLSKSKGRAGKLEPTSKSLQEKDKVETSPIEVTSTQKPETESTKLSQNDNVPRVRNKSKKRTRRFAPIKDSSSESGALSDDGNPSNRTAIRITRARRKTISSASELDEIASLSPPDLALEYSTRKTTPEEEKSQEKKINLDEDPKEEQNIAKIEKNDLNLCDGTKAKEKCAAESKPKVGRPKKDTRNANNKQIEEILKEPESESKQLGLALPSPSPSSSDSSTAEEEENILKPRKVTRLFLKTQRGSDNEDKTTKALENVPAKNIKDLVSQSKESQAKFDHTEEHKNQDSTQELLQHTNKNSSYEKEFSSTTVITIDPEVSGKSSKQKKGTKSLAAETIDKLKENIEKETCLVVEDSQIKEIATTKSDSSKEDSEKSPILKNVTRPDPKCSDFMPSPYIESHDILGDQLSDKRNDPCQTQGPKLEENRSPTEQAGEASKTTELAKVSGSRKITRTSAKKMDKNDESITQITNSKSNDFTKSAEEQIKTPRQKKPTRFSPRSPESKTEEQQTKEEEKTDEVDGHKETIISTPKSRKTTRFSPKSSESTDKTKDTTDTTEEQTKTDPKSDVPADSSQSKLEISITEDDALISKLTENSLVQEQTNCFSTPSVTSKLEEPTKRTKRPTRFSPRSPDKLKTDAVDSEDAKMSVPDEATLSRLDEVDKPSPEVEFNNLTRLDEEMGTEEHDGTPKLRKGTRFSAKSVEIDQDTKKSPESKVEVEEVDVSSASLETKELQVLAKLSDAIKLTEFPENTFKSSTYKETTETDKNMKNVCQPSEHLQQSKGESNEIAKTTRQKQKLAQKETNIISEHIESLEIQDEKRSNSVSIASISQEPQAPAKENLSSNNIALKVNQLVAEANAFKPADIEVPSNNTISSSPRTPTSKCEITKKGIRKQLQSMLDSLSSHKTSKSPGKLSKSQQDKVAKKETTPRRKNKKLEHVQESTDVTQDSLNTATKIDDPNTEFDSKFLSSESNQSEDSSKVLEANKIKTKQTPRRQLDSSFIESLEKCLRPISSKKSSKKKEKEKEQEKEKEKEKELTTISTPKSKEETKQIKKIQESFEELKKSGSASPKVKKKQSKESSKMDKKLSEEHTTPSKRKSLAKFKELEGIKPLEPEPILSVMSNDVSMTMTQSPKPIESTVVIPQTPKTKGETKFFSNETPLIQNEPLDMVEKTVAPTVIVKEKSPDLLPDPLKDIEKFIEDGVNLLKRCYKIDADDDVSLDRDILKPDDSMSLKKCKLDESNSEEKVENPPDDENSNSNSECSTMTTNTSTSDIDTPNGIRRSHRIKNNSKSTKCLVGRGLVRERERFSTKDDEKTIYSIDDQKMGLAEVEAKNSKFLKEMEERLSNFRVIRENEYKCERVISKEAKRMICDCFLTPEEEERGELGCGEDCLNRLLMIECGTDCTVRERCTNRRFNKFLYSPCRVFRTEKKGFGIMAEIEILPDEFIMEYVGEVINGDEFEHRINEYSKDKNKHYYFMALRSDAVIDATAKGNISRFINHSCDPNAETQKWTVNGELRIGFFSRKSIMPGEEITFDYQYQRYGKEAQRCYCESANCRGWIGEEPSSEEEEYEGPDEEGESEEFEEEGQRDTAVPVPITPDLTTPAVIAVPDLELPLVPVIASEVPAIEVKLLPTPLPIPAPTAEPLPVLEVSKELPLKKKKEKKRLLEDKIKRREPKQFLEDPDIEDEVRFLVKCGLRNQADTLRLSRLIVRAKLLETRIKLLQILRKGELPCRRLFLDYHGLRLLHGWMSEVIDTRDTEKNMEIRMELLSALECLPISNKTMLTDSKVYQTVRDWSNNKESRSPSDNSPKESNASPSPAEPTDYVSSELQKLAAKLVNTWDNLPEIFRIPKRERIEQMKEHEREADRQYKGLGENSMFRSDGYRNRERFISKRGQKSHFKRPKERERDRVNERRKYAHNSNGKDGNDKSTSSQVVESQLSKEQRRELFAAKVARDEAEKRQAEERREFDIKCRFFGLDPKRIRPTNMPFCVNPSTGQWYSTEKKPIATPPSYAHVQVPVKPKSTNPEDYRLPELDLPPLWKFAISPKGKIYYYHVKIRIPQWEPPIKILPLAGQQDAQVKNSESDSSNVGINDSSEDDIDVIKGLDPVKLQIYIEKKIEDRRLQRYTRLVEEKPISPRKEEDRLYNQMEVRKYKENKEKIRKRKEEIRKRRDIETKTGSIDSSNLSETVETDESTVNALPIQDYLLSSEEEELLKAECNNSPLIDKIVQGDKIVDELDALQKKRALKRALPIREKYEHKKRKVDKIKDSSKSTKRNKDGEGSSSSSKYRKLREKFRCEIAGIIVQHLKPYRNDACFTGKILTDDDFNHLARKLTHFVMVKELKYCESIGQTLFVTESVKNKSREFIKKYMAKYGKVYVRPKNDPEFKEIPFL